MDIKTGFSVGDTFYFVTEKHHYEEKICVDCGGTGKVFSIDPSIKTSRNCPYCYNGHIKVYDKYLWEVAKLQNGEPIKKEVHGIEIYVYKCGKGAKTNIAYYHEGRLSDQKFKDTECFVSPEDAQIECNKRNKLKEQQVG